MTLSLGAAAAQSPQWHDLVDYTKLKERMGASLPLGGGGVVSEVEGSTPNTKAYFVDGASPQFDGSNDPFGEAVNLIDGSGGAYRGVSGHATNVVGARFFGDLDSLAPGANQVVVYEASQWLANVIKYSSSLPPEPQNFRVQNHSWVATMAQGNPTPPPNTEHPDNVKVLERFDYLIETANNGDGMIAAVGLNNSQNPIPYLLSHSYNAIGVGRSDGQHSAGLTLADDGTPPDSTYGPGRSKPDLVAPLPSTSAATAAVSSAATLLYSSADGLGMKQEVIKATLLAGATKSEFPNWTRAPTQPLDDVFGAGELNIYNSVALQSGGLQRGQTSAPATPVALNGWDYVDHRQSPQAGDVYYNLRVPTGSRLSELSIVLTWNLTVTDSDSSPSRFIPVRSLKDLNLGFYNSTSQFLGSLLDSSISAVDNVEHVYLKDLGPGLYTLRVSGSAGVDYGLAWRSTTAFDVPSADFNGDHIVDGSDFLIWQRGFGTLANGGSRNGDADGDGDVDSDDLGLWRAAVGGPATAPLAVPEPTSLLVAAALAALLGLGIRACGSRLSGR